MHRIDGPYSTADNKFTEGDPVVPIKATVVTDDWLNAVQEELCSVIEDADIPLNKNNNAQLIAALGSLGSSALLTLRRWGIMPWSDDLNYYQGAVVLGPDLRLYQSKLESGPGGVGPKPVTNEAYWKGGIPFEAAVAATPNTLVLRDNNGNFQSAAPVVDGDVAIKTYVDAAITERRHYLCEFYYMRHPTLRPGFKAAQGGLLANAATLYPEAWAYLQTTEGQLLCKTESQWQALTQAVFATLADGTAVGWDGIGGAPYYAMHMDTGALRLPDLRGMYMEAAGYDSLDVGGSHGDGIRNVTGKVSIETLIASTDVNYAEGAFYQYYVGHNIAAFTGSSSSSSRQMGFNAARIVPVAPRNRPAAYGVLACVYLGKPAS
jgi:hypothetical protein